MKIRMGKIIGGIILTLVIMLAFNSSTYAVGGTYNVVMTPSKNKLRAGETLRISVSLDNINVSGGLAAYEANIEYDKNVFENLQIEGNSTWDNPTINENKFVSTKSDGIAITEAQEVAIITLTVKSAPIFGNTTIKLKGILASDGESDIPTQDVNITEEIEEETRISVNSYEMKNFYIRRLSPNTTIQSVKSNIKTNRTYQIKDKDGIKLEDTQVAKTGCKVILSSGEEYELVIRGDLNGDGKVSITDLAKIKKQVVGSSLLIGAYKEAADVNLDSNISATDLLQVKKAVVELIVL